MNNQARVCELKCIYNVQGICYAYGECIAKDLFISELEKIKKEAEELIGHCDSDYEFEEIYGIKLVVGILDKHISELKGE